MTYPENLIGKAARAAYRASVSGNDDEYVAMKSRSFVERCHAFDGTGEGDDISVASVKDVAFAALDPYCSLQLWSFIEREGDGERE